MTVNILLNYFPLQVRLQLKEELRKQSKNSFKNVLNTEVSELYCVKNKDSFSFLDVFYSLVIFANTRKGHNYWTDKLTKLDNEYEFTKTDTQVFQSNRRF